MKIIIYTSFECLIKSDDKQELIDENSHIEIDHTPTSLYVYPTGKTHRISFEIDLNEKDSLLYRIIEKDDKLLIFLLDGIIAENYKIASLNCEEKICKIEIGKRSVCFICENHKKKICLPCQTTDSKVGSIYHIAYCHIKNKTQEFFIAYNCNTFQSKIFKGNKIEVNENGFSVTSANHYYKKIDQQYQITREGIKIKKQSFASNDASSKTIAYQFLISVKLEDYQTAFHLLSPGLSENLSVKTMKEYFGKISFIFPLDEYNLFAISNNFSIIYTFNIENNKITEISDSKN